MSVFSLLLNILWIVFGGLWMAIGWVIAAVTLADAAVLTAEHAVEQSQKSREYREGVRTVTRWHFPVGALPTRHSAMILASAGKHPDFNGLIYRSPARVIAIRSR